MTDNGLIPLDSSTQQNETVEENYSESRFFQIHDPQDKDFPAFGSRIRTIKVDIVALPPSEHFLTNLKYPMKRIFETLTDGCDRKDLMLFEIATDLEFESPDKAFKPIGKLSHKQLENLIQDMVDRKFFDAGDSFEIRATHIKIIGRNSKCDRCQQQPMCTDTLNEIRCPVCLFDFNGQECFNNHLKTSGSSTWTRCQTNRRCPVCKTTYNSALNEHDCKCRICNSEINGDHKCYMRKLDSVPIDKRYDGYDESAFLFYDFEAMQEKNYSADNKLPEVNLCVAQLAVCRSCFDSDLKEKCTVCKTGRTYIFQNVNENDKPVEKLLSLIFEIELPTSVKRLICIAHNSRNYDAQFILKHVVENTKINPDIILKGRSIIFMSFKNKFDLEVKFIDSINYFDMKLADLPKTFGFEDMYKKGYFPYLFNTKENQNYKGPLPAESYYDVADMKDKDWSEFRKWYKEMQKKNCTFDFKKEIVDYCLSDVNILRKACSLFRDMFIERTGIDPFVAGVTMPGICMKVFRTKLTSDNIIGIIPNGGYRKQNQRTSDALNPRDAFYGGRMETYTAHREISGDEKINYIDVCSLYPWVNKYGKVPIKHPDIYFGDDCEKITGSNNDISSVEGLIKCSILAPNNLYHPVLPVRINGQTTFSLCRLCCENSVKDDCPHDRIEDREFTGTWVSDELKKAIEMGYRITRIYEIWQYEVEQYNKVTRKGGIFTDYVDEFFKWKQSASGWPADCLTTKDQQEYIDEYERREGIRLIHEDVVENPGLRFIGKRALNCLWGKFGQKYYGTDKVMRSPDDLLDIVSCPDKILKSVRFVENKPIGYCKWMYKDEYIKPSEDRNVVIAVYTTAQARLKLYEYLEHLGDRVLYCHTDSCIYVSSPNKGYNEIETGDFLGDMSNALVKKYGKGAYIREFVSCSSSLYSMIVVQSDGTEKIVTKGVPIEGGIDQSNKNYSHENIKALALGKKEKIKHSFKSKCHDVVTSEKSKTDKTSFLMRKFPNLYESYESYPYGFKRSRN